MGASVNRAAVGDIMIDPVTPAIKADDAAVLPTIREERRLLRPLQWVRIVHTFGLPRPLRVIVVGIRCSLPGLGSFPLARGAGPVTLRVEYEGVIRPGLSTLTAPGTNAGSWAAHPMRQAGR